MEMKDTFNRATKWGPRFHVASKVTLFTMALVIVSATSIYVASTFNVWSLVSSLESLTTRTIASNGSEQWVNDTLVTIPANMSFSPTASNISILPVFEKYQQHHGGANNLGNPLTTALFTNHGWLQFFTSGALLLPATAQDHTLKGADTLTNLVKKGITDQATGVVRLPLIQQLLALGSRVPISGQGSSISYVDLRKATHPDLMASAYDTYRNGTPPPFVSSGEFIKCGVRAGKEVGHLVALPFWDYINRADISPDGWRMNFGLPLTEALPFTLKDHQVAHHMLIQVFAYGGLLLDQDIRNGSGQPLIQLLQTGTDYLRTLDLPALVAKAKQRAWVQKEAVLFKAPGEDQQAVAHVGQNFPLALLGHTKWIYQTLWYDAQWTTPNSTFTGWISSSHITFTSPGNVAGWAATDALSPDLQAYLASLDPHAGVVVYDITNQRYYTYNGASPFVTASSIKVLIMLTFFDMIERQGRDPDDTEMNMLTTMIENSNNDSASELYYHRIGGSSGIVNFLQKIGVNGLVPSSDADGWGYSLITPQMMVDVLALLQKGRIMVDRHRIVALQLMQNVQDDQRFGLGTTAPAGATVALKNGWVVGPDNQWAVNTSGIVTVKQETYVVAVYTRGLASMDSGIAILEQVCRTVAAQLA